MVIQNKNYHLIKVGMLKKNQNDKDEKGNHSKPFTDLGVGLLFINQSLYSYAYSLIKSFIVVLLYGYEIPGESTSYRAGSGLVTAGVLDGNS